jgi:hypothetical protein
MNATPSRPYEDPRAAVHARLSPLLTTLDAPLPPSRLLYRISGGPPGRRLEATLELSAQGAVKHELLDELQDSEREVVRSEIPAAEARALLREVVRSGLITDASSRAGFLPDSLIGSILIQSGDAQYTHHFLASERQRRRQGLPLDPAVRRLRPQLEALRARARRTSRRPFEPPT